MKIKNVFFFLTGLVSLVSCLNPDKTKDLSLEINTSLPLGNYYLNDRELFEQTALKNTVVEDEQGQLSIQESTESILMDQTKMNKLIVLENQSIDHQLSGLSMNQDISNMEMPFDLSVAEGERIDRLLLRGGTISMQEEPALSGLRCTVQGMTLPDGKPLTLEPGRVVPLEGVVLEPIHNQDVANGLVFVYSGYYSGSDNEVNIHIEMENMSFEELTGYVGRKELEETRVYLNANDEAVEFFEQIDEIYLANPYIEFRVKNDLELPVAVILNSFQINGQEITLIDGFEKNRFLIGTGETTIRIDNSNTQSGTGISDAINRDFSYIECIMQTVVNPTKEDLLEQEYVPEDMNAFRYDSELIAQTLFTLPLDGCLRGFSLESDFDFNLDMKDYVLEQIQLAITGENGFPLDFSLQLISVDRSTHEEVVLNEMPVEIEPAEGGKPGGEGFIPFRMDASNFRLITLDKKQSDAFVNAEKIYFRLKASTRNAAEKENVKIYAGSYLNLKLTIGVNGEIEL